MRERFLREAEICRTLDHPNLVRVYDAGDVEMGPSPTGRELLQEESRHDRRRGRLRRHVAKVSHLRVQLLAVGANERHLPRRLARSRPGRDHPAH